MKWDNPESRDHFRYQNFTNRLLVLNLVILANVAVLMSGGIVGLMFAYLWAFVGFVCVVLSGYLIQFVLNVIDVLIEWLQGY